MCIAAVIFVLLLVWIGLPWWLAVAITLVACMALVAGGSVDS